MGSAPANVRDICRAARADGPAAVLAIGTANPANCFLQDEFADVFFRATKSEHLVDLKEKFKRVCQKLGVQKRYLHHNEEMILAHPEFLHHVETPSLDERLDITKTAVPELAAEASRKAIAEWGRPVTDITHLVVTTNSGAHIPGVDSQLVPLLGLRPSVRRTMLYLNGCFAGAPRSASPRTSPRTTAARACSSSAPSSPSCSSPSPLPVGPSSSRRLSTRACSATARAPSSSAPTP
ncbi:unnamed protein product [Urochloa humidicola]